MPLHRITNFQTVTHRLKINYSANFVQKNTKTQAFHHAHDNPVPYTTMGDKMINNEKNEVFLWQSKPIAISTN